MKKMNDVVWSVNIGVGLVLIGTIICVGYILKEAYDEKHGKDDC